MEPIKVSNSSQPISATNQDTAVSNPTIPREIIMLIFSQLDELDISKAGLVDKYFNVEVLNSIKREEFNLLNSFLNGLSSHLNTMKTTTPSAEIDEVIKKIEELFVNANERKPINLLEVKSSLMSVKNELVTILKQLPLEKLMTLMQLTVDKTPLSWEMEIYPDLVPAEIQPMNKLFVLTALLASKDIDEDLEVFYKDQEKAELAATLLNYGFVDKAINLADTISDQTSKRKTFNYLAVLLCEAGYMKKGIEVAKAQGIEKDNIFKELGHVSASVRHLVNYEKFDEIIEIAGKLDIKNKDAFLTSVSLEFWNQSQVENAYKAYYLISDSDKDPSKADAFFLKA